MNDRSFISIDDLISDTRPIIASASLMTLSWRPWSILTVRGTTAAAELTITVARDLRCPDGPCVTGADRDGQLSLGFGADAAPRR